MKRRSFLASLGLSVASSCKTPTQRRSMNNVIVGDQNETQGNPQPSVDLEERWPET